MFGSFKNARVCYTTFIVCAGRASTGDTVSFLLPSSLPWRVNYGYFKSFDETDVHDMGYEFDVKTFV